MRNVYRLGHAGDAPAPGVSPGSPVNGALVRAYAEGKRPTGIPEEAAAIIARHAPIAAVISDFNLKFRCKSRQTPYPLEEIRGIGGLYSPSVD
jgi:hypothetical protein